MTDLVLDPSALDAMYENLLRPYLQIKLDSIQTLAESSCPRGKPPAFGREPEFPTKLYESHTNRIDGTGVTLIGYVTAGTPYAFFVHEGTNPHPIEANSAKALMFEGGNGEMVFRKHVDHPGTPAQPWLKDAMVTVISQ